MRFILFLSLMLWFNSCGKDNSNNETIPDQRYQNSNVTADNKKHNVLVVDDGFDLNHPVFRNKIVARYRLRCEKPNTPILNPTEGFESQKQKLIRSLSVKDSSCILSRKIPFQASRNLESIQDKRLEWNDALTRKTISQTYKNREWEAENIFRTINEGGKYHGTNTAGLIAYQNDMVNLFIIQLELGAPQSALASITATRTNDCPSQENIDFTTRLYLDPDVQDAYAKAPLETISSQDAEINKIIKRHSIKIVNKSYGIFPIDVIQKGYQDIDCPANVTPLFEAQAKLIDARRQKNNSDTPDALILQAAGNEGVEINTLKDSLDCSEQDDNTLLVGGINLNAVKTEWTNFGNCVELFAVGERVITPAPLDFLNLSSGTSFASPLTVRYATLNNPTKSSIDEIKKNLVDSINDNKILDLSHAPEELVYENPKVIEGYSLNRKAGIEVKNLEKRTQTNLMILPYVLQTRFE